MNNPIPEAYNELRSNLRATPKRWLVTGVAGFIGSALLSELLALGQEVVGLDNLSTGHESNLADVLAARSQAVSAFKFVKGDIREPAACREAVAGVDYILHQAALGSVPRSIDDPVTSTRVNVDGFLNVLVAARDAGVGRVVYASSSSVYGDARGYPQVEPRIGRPLSPYAATKLANEIFAEVFQRTYGSELIGLRYFNVFGPRQDPNGPYAAVIPRWIDALLTGRSCRIFGDGQTSRDFCYVENAVQANLLAAAAAPSEATGSAYNIACGESTTLSSLFCMLRDGLANYVPSVRTVQPVHDGFRPGDVPRSMADISAAREKLAYEPTHRIAGGLEETVQWYVRRAGLTQ